MVPHVLLSAHQRNISYPALYVPAGGCPQFFVVLRPGTFVSRNFYKCWAVAMGMRGYRPTEATASDAPTDFFARHGALSTLMCVEAPCVAILCTSIEAVRSGVTIRDLCRVLSS